MVVIKNIDKVEKIIGRWYAGDLAYIVNLKFVSQTADSISSIIIDALFQVKDRTKPRWPSESEPWFSVSIQFGEIANLKLNNFGGMPKQIMGFDICDISDRSWEGKNFYIEDYENGAIQFYCKEICILSAEIKKT